MISGLIEKYYHTLTAYLKFVSLSAGLLFESNHPTEDAATDRIDEGFLDFPTSSNKC